MFDYSNIIDEAMDHPIKVFSTLRHPAKEPAVIRTSSLFAEEVDNLRLKRPIPYLQKKRLGRHVFDVHLLPFSRLYIAFRI